MRPFRSSVFIDDPAYRSLPPWLPPGSDLNDQDPLPRLVLNIEEQGIDERDRVSWSPYGDMLFDSPLRSSANRPVQSGRHLFDLPQPQRHQSTI